ncbi:MAG: flagellar motor protein MotB, partial [Planctomycetaceae bacterium]
GLPATLPSYADVDGRQLDGMLTRSRQESQLMQTEITALREHLASTSAQLAQVRAAGLPPARPASDTDNPVSSPAAMQSAATQLALPDLQPRFDGAVVRNDMPADRLFEPGTANLLPAGTSTLTTVAEEIERVFPGHYVGIEGHTDSEPLVNASWGSPHQLTTARAVAVFDFLTSRTPVRENQLFLVAHGSNHPLVSNATPAGRARNRRVELVVYAERTGAAP